jgi:3-deoxy-D-manno-octulosonic-acid transferase
MNLPTGPVEAAHVADRPPPTLHGYHLLTASAVPLAEAFLKYRLKRGKEHAERLPERALHGRTAGRSAGLAAWRERGEPISILPLIERIRARDLAVLVTTGTVTSAGLAERRLTCRVIHQFAPIDMPQFVASFLDHWRPNLALFAESDLWPNLIMASAKRKIPLILVNGRMSERSYRHWRLAPRTIGALLSRFDLCLTQSAEDAARYASLGAPRYVTTGNLKLDVPAPPADPDKLAALKNAIGGRPVIAAASTHPGEETVLIDVHRRLRHTFPGLLTVLVPRHPERGPGRRRDCQGRGHQFRAALARRIAGRLDRNLRGGYRRRAWADLPDRADRIHRRFADPPRRTKPDRGRQAWRRHSARPAYLEFH